MRTRLLVGLVSFAILCCCCGCIREIPTVGTSTIQDIELTISTNKSVYSYKVLQEGQRMEFEATITYRGEEPSITVWYYDIPCVFMLYKKDSDEPVLLVARMLAEGCTTLYKDEPYSIRYDSTVLYELSLYPILRGEYRVEVEMQVFLDVDYKQEIKTVASVPIKVQ